MTRHTKPRRPHHTSRHHTAQPRTVPHQYAPLSLTCHVLLLSPVPLCITSFNTTLLPTSTYITHTIPLNHAHTLHPSSLQLIPSQVFATNSHADTYCPYLHAFIKRWAEIPDADAADPDVEQKLKLTDDERYQRRVANLIRYPYIAATFFHLKTELYVEHICKGIMGADAHWMRYVPTCRLNVEQCVQQCVLPFSPFTLHPCPISLVVWFRYEWQSRGSTHVHYFLWLRDAPNLSYLDEWVRETALQMFGEKAELDEAKADQLVARLNERAKAAISDCSCESPACACDRIPCQACVQCDCNCHFPLTAAQLGETAVCTCNCLAARDPEERTCDCRATRDAKWWEERCTRWSDAWDKAADKPDSVGDDHPSTKRHWSHTCLQDECSVADNESLTAQVDSVKAEVSAVRNQVNRHSKHTPYCLRRDPKTGKLIVSNLLSF